PSRNRSVQIVMATLPSASRPPHEFWVLRRVTPSCSKIFLRLISRLHSFERTPALDGRVTHMIMNTVEPIARMGFAAITAHFTLVFPRYTWTIIAKVRIERRYRSNTLVLETEFTAAHSRHAPPVADYVIGTRCS